MSSVCLFINLNIYIKFWFWLFIYFYLQSFKDSQRGWRTDITSTVNWSIFNRSTSAQDTLTPANGNGWSTSTETLTAHTWDILTCSTTSPWPRTRAKRVSASTWWRRCFNHVDHLQTNLMMPRLPWSQQHVFFSSKWFFCMLGLGLSFSCFFDIQLYSVPKIFNFQCLTITFELCNSFVWPCQKTTRNLVTYLFIVCIWTTEKLCFLQLSGKWATMVKEGLQDLNV